MNAMAAAVACSARHHPTGLPVQGYLAPSGSTAVPRLSVRDGPCRRRDERYVTNPGFSSVGGSPNWMRRSGSGSVSPEQRRQDAEVCLPGLVWRQRERARQDAGPRRRGDAALMTERVLGQMLRRRSRRSYRQSDRSRGDTESQTRVCRESIPGSLVYVKRIGQAAVRSLEEGFEPAIRDGEAKAWRVIGNEVSGGWNRRAWRTASLAQWHARRCGDETLGQGAIGGCDRKVLAKGAVATAV